MSASAGRARGISRVAVLVAFALGACGPAPGTGTLPLASSPLRTPPLEEPVRRAASSSVSFGDESQ